MEPLARNRVLTKNSGNTHNKQVQNSDVVECFRRSAFCVVAHEKVQNQNSDVMVCFSLACAFCCWCQEMRANVDLEFVLHLLDLVTSLVPELTSEEVLAKMCRKKAKLAVRHTVSEENQNNTAVTNLGDGEPR